MTYKVGSLPTYSTGRTTSLREIHASDEGIQLLPNGIIIDKDLAIDGSNTGYTKELRPGCIMARITSTGRYVPCKRTKVNATGATGATVVVDNAAFFNAGDTISVGSDNVTIQSVDYTTNTITLTGSITYADNEDVIARGSLAGAETAVGILPVWRTLWNDDKTAYENTHASLEVAGYYFENMLIGDWTNIKADTAALLQGIKTVSGGVPKR